MKNTISGIFMAVLFMCYQVISYPALANEPITVTENKRSPDERVPMEIWAVHLQEDENPDKTAQDMGAENLGRVGYLPNIYKFKFPGSHTRSISDKASSRLNSEKRIKWFQQQVARWRFLRTISFDDPLFPNQWHLVNTGQGGGTAGQDINVLPAWNQGFTGNGVVIGIVDDGLQYTHPDIQLNYRKDLSYNFNCDPKYSTCDPGDPTPSSWDSHGTATAGLAAARDNKTCGVGVAFHAGLAGLRLIANTTVDSEEAEGLSYRRDAIHIYSNSWGPDDFGNNLDGPGPLTLAAFEDNVKNGRNGLGSIYIWAGGNGRQNGDNVNYDGYANSRFVISVGAVDENGKQAYYSESGACLAIVVPSDSYGPGITTTDLLGSAGDNRAADGDCTNKFGGTSAAAPLAAGVVALMLETNPNLTWRDVKHILIKSAVKIDPTDSDWTYNGSGLHINHKYGFGRIDASEAVNISSSWLRVPELVSHVYEPIIVKKAIPDNDPKGISSTFTVNDAIRLEHVEVIFNATHPYRGNLQVVLTSPSGVKSVLAETHKDDHANYSGWKFMTVRNWDDSSVGTWTLQVSDMISGNTGTFDSWELLLYGTPWSDRLGEAILILKMLAGITAETNFNDINNNGKIGLEEAVYLLQKAANIRK